MPGTDLQAQVRGRAAPGCHAASLCSGAGRLIPREGARTPVALNEYATRAPHLPVSLAWQREASTYGVAVMPSNSTAVNGDPGGGGGSTGWHLRGHLDLDHPLPGAFLRVDHLHDPQRQPAVLVGLLDHPVRGGPVEVPHHLDPPAAYAPSGNTAPNGTGTDLELPF